MGQEDRYCRLSRRLLSLIRAEVCFLELFGWVVDLLQGDMSEFLSCVFDQGVLLEHREKEFGDKVSLPSVLEAAEKIKPQAS